MAWPSVETLAKKTGLSTRQIRRILPELEKAGLVKIIPGGGRKRTNLYQFIWLESSDNKSSYLDGNGDNLSEKGDTMSPDLTRTKEKNKISSDGPKKPRKLQVAL